MKISYRTQGTGAYTVLADDTAGALITGFVPQRTGIAQVTPLFRAANALVVARGNRTWVVRGTVEVESASADAAWDFCQTQDAAIPDYVDLKIEQGATVKYLTPAVFAGFDPTVKGRSSSINYTFLGANLTPTAP